MSAIEERIRKLMALADSPNEHEAAEKGAGADASLRDRDGDARRRAGERLSFK
jgi:hypothetical protein